MCGTPFWGVVAAAGCTYFAYVTFSQLREGDFYWQHEWWTIFTWAVWVLLIAALISETRCGRERILFGLVFLNFLLGFVLAAWSDAPPGIVRGAREASLTLWILSALASLNTLRKPASTEPKL